MSATNPPSSETAEPSRRKPLYKRGWFLATVAVIGIPALALAWYLGSPLFLNETVIEEFPTAAAAAPAAADDDMTDSDTTDGDMTDDDMTDSEMTDDGHDDDAEMADGEMTDDGHDDDAEMADGEMTDDDADVATATAAPAGPIALFAGSFAGADASHEGAGDVTIYELEDGSRVLRFEGLDVTNGPDLHVIVSPVASVEGNDDVMATGYVDLGKLKGNRGDQNYELPADLDLSGPVSIVIYCDPFHVIFATAELTPAA